jgi:hypothetical protein
MRRQTIFRKQDPIWVPGECAECADKAVPAFFRFIRNKISTLRECADKIDATPYKCAGKSGKFISSVINATYVVTLKKINHSIEIIKEKCADRLSRIILFFSTILRGCQKQCADKLSRVFLSPQRGGTDP